MCAHKSIIFNHLSELGDLSSDLIPWIIIYILSNLECIKLNITTAFVMFVLPTEMHLVVLNDVPK